MSEMLATRTRRAMIVDCFMKYLEAHPSDVLNQKKLCEAIRVNENSLRRACKQQFGVGPDQYAKRYRIQLARLALLTADPSRKTVTEIAVDFGFTHLGRFSVVYREVFGEAPSATLRSKRCLDHGWEMETNSSE